MRGAHVMPTSGRQRDRRNQRGSCIVHTTIERDRHIRAQAEPLLWSKNVGYAHPRRVIHTYPHPRPMGRSPSAPVTIRQSQRNDGNGGSPHKKGRPAEAGLPCKNPQGRISAQLHRRNGKSIQCPFNVTTYLGHTLFVGLCSSIVLVLRNYARHPGHGKPEQDNVPYFSKLLAFDRNNHGNAPYCANHAACLFVRVRLSRENGVSNRHFAKSANEC